MEKRSRGLVRTGVIVSLALAAPVAAAADIFAWRTEDGVFAYADERDKIPARYADDAVVVRESQLQAYPRLTVEDTRATRDVSARLEKRLDYLRQVNAATPAAREAAVAAAAAGAGHTVVSVPMGFA